MDDKAKNLNRKIPASEKLLKVIDYNYCWEEYYTITENITVCWWWHGFSREKESFNTIYTEGAAHFSIVKIVNDDVLFWGEQHYLLSSVSEKTGKETFSSRWNQVPNKKTALDLYEGMTKNIEPDIEGEIDGKIIWGEKEYDTLTAIFYTLT